MLRFSALACSTTTGQARYICLEKGMRLPLVLLSLLLGACTPAPQDGGEIHGLTPRPASLVAAETERSREILFGDLHTHTSFSPDGFILGMPLLGGEGARPPADACDYARYCSALDFWGISDHAEGLSPRRWQQTRQAIRQCNAIAGDEANPDLVSFLGWEWSQVALTPEAHFGHKNVFFVDTADDRVPSRSIAAPRRQFNQSPLPRFAQYALAAMDWGNRDYYLGIDAYYDEIAATPLCERGVNSRQLPDDCLEIARDPGELFDKLDDWGFDALVIPHGNAWGLATPPQTSWNKQLSDRYHNPAYQRLVEIYSGHGNSEEYRANAPFRRDENGNPWCPEPDADFLPCCWRAGELIQQRCEDPVSAACQTRVAEARRIYLDAGISGHLTVPGAEVADWLNCGQCTDCFNPPFKHRPGVSTQYALTLHHPDNAEGRRKFRWGFIGSSDNHRARAGNGFKDSGRRQGNTETMGAGVGAGFAGGVDKGRQTDLNARRIETLGPIGLNELRNQERQQSFYLTGGLVAVHSEGRNREAIWAALKQRRVYATSGDRMLLWFELLNGVDGAMPMGSVTRLSRTPRFRVRAAGAFEQLPGCPGHVAQALGTQRQRSLCANECYNPGASRKLLERIEIIRIRPRQSAGETTAELIEDPWQSFSCRAGDGSCAVEFEDPEFIEQGREMIYYARAVQQATPAVNAGGLRCEYDEQGICVAVNPCYGDARTDFSDDCRSPNQERAWSSPIYLDFAGSRQ